MSGDDFASLVEKLLRMLRGDTTPPKPAKPVAPKRPASFYDPPEDAVDTFGADSASPFHVAHGAAEFAHDGSAPESAIAPAFPVYPIPDKVARVVEQGGIVTIEYSRRRKLGMAVVVLLIGTILSLLGVMILVAGPQNPSVALVMLLVGALVDLVGINMIVSSLQVVAGGGKLRVEQRGLFGRKQFDVAGASIERIESTLSYTVTSGNKKTNYYTVTAHTADPARILLGNSIPGEKVADAVAFRVASALRLRPEAVKALDWVVEDD